MLTMNYTYRIYPNVVQQAELRSWLETCRGVYNYALRELKDWIASRKCQVDRCSLEKEYIIPADEPFPSYHRQQNNLPKAKKQFPHLGQVHSQVLQTTIRRLHDTWEAFQKRGHGFPRFKKFGQFKSFVFPQFKNNPINGFTIKLPKIGEVPINLHRPIPDGFKVKQVRVLSRVRGTQWYVVVTIESDISVPDVPVHGRAIGIDLGLERFLTASDRSFQERPQFFKSMQGKLKLLQRRAARKQKGSQNWEKAQIEVARMHHRIANRRKDFHLKTAHQLCDRAQTIFAEDLNVKGLTRGMLRTDCVDAAFGQFLSLTEWVCWKRGVYFAKVNPNGTSQTCPNCLATVSKGLEVREHHCPECGDRTHRDHAAAEMVLHRGLENVVSQGLWGTETACQVGLSGVYDLDKWRGAGTPNREAGKPAL
ncbi:transposase [Oxynema sp. CENA135]|uniref:RNA-guided endonuclease InsQ/TnpB family protein n=1 Tax=Oxynema sp. CENA135 TaxID=984206 RepID=UPI00190B1FC8|nr:RNA-guided endonuclease TnpB family protein [Oxynema sp. CENA135]MBK4732007.1 transposase [Oxynema sp. CENA135]